MREYLDTFAKEDAVQAKRLKEGLITKEQYLQWRAGKIATGKRWANLRDSLAEDLANTQLMTAGMINNTLVDIYAENANFALYEIERGTNSALSFNLYDKNAVRRLLDKDPNFMPTVDPKIPKELRWNRQHITSQMLQGILLGESIPKMAKRMRNVTNMDRAASIRNARTYTTSVENGAKYDRYKQAEGMGIGLEKMWLSARDDRVRDSHRVVDGEIVPLDKTFSNKLMYPGDPEGRPEEIYNCRCRIVSIINGHEYTDIEPKIKGGESYEEWKKGKKKEAKSQVVNGKDLSSTWERRSDEFKYDIDDVVNAQGFDGKPRVVSAEEFDKYVKQANGGEGFVAQRTYSGPDEQAVNTYRDELYNGKWYISCDTGGSAYGKGMYCAGNYEGELTDKIRKEMKDYQMQNLNYSGKDSAHLVETLTLDKSAKIIDEKDINKMQVLEGSRMRAYSEAISKANLTDEELAYALADYRPAILNNSDLFPWSRMKEVDSLAQKLDRELSVDEWYKRYDEVMKKIDVSGVEERVKQGQKLRELDTGAYAALKGYDAIRTEHGTCRADTIILNRTKVIFRGE